MGIAAVIAKRDVCILVVKWNRHFTLAFPCISPENLHVASAEKKNKRVGASWHHPSCSILQLIILPSSCGTAPASIPPGGWWRDQPLQMIQKGQKWPRNWVVVSGCHSSAVVAFLRHFFKPSILGQILRHSLFVSNAYRHRCLPGLLILEWVVWNLDVLLLWKNLKKLTK